MAGSRSIGGIFATLRLNDKPFTDGIKRAKLAMKDIREGQRGGLVNRDRAGVSKPMDFKGMASGAAAMATGVGAVAAAFVGLNQAMMASLSMMAELDSLKMGMKTLEGTAGLAGKRIEELRKLALAPGLGFEQAVRGDIRLRSAGLSAKDSAEAIQEMGNALATVGGSSDDLDGVFKALSQIAAKSKVSAEEINQLAERLPQIRQVMQKAFGTADTEELQKRGIDTLDFIKAIVVEFAKLERVEGGAQNALDNYTDAMKAMKTQWGETVDAGGWTEGITSALNNYTGYLKWVKQGLDNAAELAGMKAPPGPDKKPGETEAARMARLDQEKAEATKKAGLLADAVRHNADIEFWADQGEKRKASLAEQLAGEKELAKEKEQSRADAMREYNKESYMLSATLSGDKDRIAAAEERLAVEEEIARLAAAGVPRDEAMGPATAIVKARIDAGKEAAPTGSPVDANSYQQRGLSLGRVNVAPHEQKQISLLEQIRDIMKIKREEPTW